MKKLSLKVLSLSILWLLTFWLAWVYAQWAAWGTPTVTTTFWSVGDSAWIGVAWAWQDKWGDLINIIKSFINRVLGILSLIALIILLRGWFQMVTAAGDETKYKKWFKILQQAAVWLVVIWVSRFVVSIIFFLLRTVWAWAQ